MADTFTVTAGDDPALHAIRIHINTADVNHLWRVTRPDYNTASRPDVIIWNDARLPADHDIMDWIAPFDTLIEYTVTDVSGAGHVVKVSATLTFHTGPPIPPAFDVTKGEWPILRAPLQPELGAFRLPVLSYDADFRMRATVHDIIGSKYPVVSRDVTLLKSGVMTWATADKTTRRRMLELMDAALLHLRGPCIEGALSDIFFVVTDLRESAPRSSNPNYRVWTVSWQQTGAPSPWSWPEPPDVTRWSVQDLADSGLSVQDLADTGWSVYELSLQSNGAVPATYQTPPDPYVGSV